MLREVPRPMRTGSRFTLPLLSLLLVSASAAHSQSCAEQLRESASRRPSFTVDAHALQIPTKAWQHFEKARVAAERGRVETFRQETEKALDIAPRFAEVYLLRATQAVRSGQYVNALDAITSARAIDPDVHWAGVVRASALNQLHRYEEAVTELNHLRAADANNWQASYELSRAETGLHHAAAALRAGDLAVAAAPTGCTEARLVRANALQIAGRQPEALAELRTYLAEDRQGSHHAEVQAVLDRARQTAQHADRSLVAMK